MSARSILLGFLFLFATLVSAQDPVKGSLSTVGEARVAVVAALPDSFPLVNLVVRAVDSTGTPFWDLRRQQVSITEDGRPCEVTCLYPITYPKPIAIALVVDHSGSMGIQSILERDTALYLRFILDSTGLKAFSDTSRTPLTYAKDGVLDFIREFDPSKDRIALTGFASTVDMTRELTGDTAALAETVRNLQPANSTALYDGVLSGLEQLRVVDGLRVVVVLTDGKDNASTKRLADVVDAANSEKIVIYAIGLGAAWRPVLDSMAVMSGGKAYYTDDAGTLSHIYAEIGRDIQAYYALTYRSINLSSVDTTRDVDLTIAFENVLLNANVSLVLSPELVEWLEQQERERTLIWGGGILALFAAGGTLFYRFRRKRKPIVERIWPVPAHTELFVHMNEPVQSIEFRQVSHGFTRSMRAAVGLNRYDISSWPSGVFVIVVNAVGKEPEGHQFIKH